MGRQPSRRPPGVSPQEARPTPERPIRVVFLQGQDLALLSPCSRERADKEVALGRAKWIGPELIRLRYDPFRARQVRKRVIARDGGLCVYCGETGDTIDHLVPWSQGGRTTMANCVCSCSECNFRRGDRPVHVFLTVEQRDPHHPVVLTHLRLREKRSEPVHGTSGTGGTGADTP